MTGHLEEYSHDQSSMAAEVEVYSACMNSPLSIMRKKKSNIKKRRFSDEQIKSLESIFETESRLEPTKKLLLAGELGLQPRQVAIWFQNKRARWKSKQIEKEYSILRANFNSLAARYESLKKEKQSLVIQLQQLNEQIGKPQEDNSQACAHSKALNSMDSAQSYNGDTVTCEAEVKAVLSEERPEHGGSGVLSDSHDSKIKAEYFSLEEGSELMNLMEPAGEDSMTSNEDWGKFDSDDLLDQSTSGSRWWDFWS